MLIFNGCKKGDTGPAGPTGPSGNTNVKAYNFSFTSTYWVADSANLQWGATYTLPSSADLSGAVLLYVKDDNNWAALPHVDYGITFEFGFDPAAKTIEIQAADATVLIMIANLGSMSFKVVTVPLATKRVNPNLNWENYKAVKSTFNL
jgi:hypothetical protein